MNNLDLKATRFGYSEALIQLIREGKDILVLDADLSKSTSTFLVKDKFPENFINVGIAEQNMVGIAAGISLNKTTPFISTYAAFVTGRAFDQIRTTVCYSNLNVKIAGMHTGISVGADGPTHQMLEDIALMRVLPNMKIFNPCDFNQAVKMTKASYSIPGPVYLRFVREATPVFTNIDQDLIIGKADEIQEGNDITIISSGTILYTVLRAAEELSNEGHSIRVLNYHTIKPIDEESIINAANETGRILVVDEHQKFGGLGSSVAQVIATNELSVKFKILAVDDMFLTSGEPEELFKITGFTKENIISLVNELLKIS